MTDDLVKRLRSLVGQYIGDADIDDDLSRAANRIEQLEAALHKIAHVNNTTPPFNSYVDKEIWIALSEARAALEGKDVHPHHP